MQLKCGFVGHTIGEQKPSVFLEYQYNFESKLNVIAFLAK
jgi:hypothetical protein